MFRHIRRCFDGGICYILLEKDYKGFPIINGKINKYLKQDVIKKVRFKLTEKNNQKIRKKRKEVKQFSLKKIELNARQERALTKIKDPERNEQLVKFLQKCQNYGK